MGIKPNWKENEIEYLVDNWGIKNIKSISKELNRSENAIIVKARKMKLGAFLDSGDYVTLNQLMNALGITNGSSYTINLWIKELGLPVRRKKVRNNSFKIIKIDKFWKWAKDNQTRLDFSKFPKNLLGEEPPWVEEKRKQDIIRCLKIEKSAKSIPWTSYDDNYLLDLLKSYKYTTDEIAEKLNRSQGAVVRRISELKIKYRPLRNSQHNPWKEQELKEIQQMIMGGGNYITMRERIDRHSEKAIRGMVYRIWKTEQLDRVRNLIEGGHTYEDYYGLRRKTI